MHTEVLAPDSLPLAIDADGVIRVGGTRVPLERLVYAWQAGESAESIAESFPALDLADIYASISYYLRHRQEVDDYIAERDREADRLQNLVMRDSPSNDLRQRLLKRSTR